MPLWVSALVPPFAWAMHLSISYALATVFCNAWAGLLHVTTIGALALAAAGVWLCWRAGDERPDEDHRTTRRATGNGSWIRFMARGGAALGIFFIFVIVIQGLPGIVLPHCPS